MLLKKCQAVLFFLAFIVGTAQSQVNLQTGSATFGLPVFNWQDNKSRLNATVALSYSSGNGLRVNEVASNVGQGWNLLAGGYITRVQNGEPDDQKPREGAFNDLTKYPPGYLYDEKYAHEGISNRLLRYPIFRSKNQLYKQHNEVGADKELDQFVFNFNGRSGTFVLGKHIGERATSLDNQRLSIWYDKNETLAASLQSRTTITAFYIQDENGLKYKFSTLERVKILSSKNCDKNFTVVNNAPSFNKGNTYYESSFDHVTVNPYIINGWHLTEIEDLFTGAKITFTYVTRNLNAISGVDVSYNEIKNDSYYLITRSKSISITPEISTINFPDGHKVQFNYNSTDRIDFIGNKALSTIDITYNTRFLSKYELNTSYFVLNRIGKPVSDYQKKNARLCLRSVRKITTDLSATEPPYVFEYYTGSNTTDDFIPGPFSPFKDIWGYFNGDNNKDFNGNTIPFTKDIYDFTNVQLQGVSYLRSGASWPVINPKAGYAKNGLLKKIIYPTGGSIAYEYGQNQATIIGQTTQGNVGGVHVSKTKVTDGGYSNDCNNPLVTNYSFALADNKSSLWGVEMPENKMVTHSRYLPEDKYFKWKWPIGGNCKYKYLYPGILSKEQAIALSANQKFWAAFNEVMNVLSSVMTVVDIVTLCLYSQGWTAIVAVVLDVLASATTILISCLENPARNRTNTSYYNTNIAAGNSLPAQFKRVVVTEGNGTNGRTISEFTSSDDYAIWEPSNASMSKKQRFAPWAYGLPKKTTILNASDVPVKETINWYNFSKAKTPLTYGNYLSERNHFENEEMYALTNSVKGGPNVGNPLFSFAAKEEMMRTDYHLSTKSRVIKVNSWRDDHWNNFIDYPSLYLTASTADVTIDRYDAYSGRVELDSTVVRNYKQGSGTNYAEQATAFSYDNYYHYQVNSIRTYYSNGDAVRKTINYSDFSHYSIPEPGVGYRNSVYIPTGSETDFVKVGVYWRRVAEERTEFIQTTNNDLKASKSFEKRYNQDGSSYEVQTQQFYYNSAGMMTGVKDEGERSLTNIYGYNDKYVVASIVNAHPVTDKTAATSFEVNGEFGGWIFSAGPENYNTTNKVTGTRSFSMNGALTAAPLNTSKAYRLSFWANAGHSISITNSPTLVKTGPVRGGLTYYEYTVPAGANSVVLYGSGTIDELRIYPQSARIRTTTYDALIGKTSECDENNRISYYQYDERGRLRFIKDDQNNTLKMYEYSETTKPECPVTYTNLRVSEVFTRNNCGANFVGSQVVYTIPAGTYTSTISQEVVDILVDQDLANNGQNYANANGTCIPLYSSAAIFIEVAKDDCPTLYFKGTTITYTVPYGKYKSTISQADADAQAVEDLNANAQVYANTSGLSTCVADTEADWIGTGSERCTGTRKEIQVRDLNPNSTTYNQVQWIDMGPSEACGGNSCPKYKITVPDNIATNLYVAYTVCDATTLTIVPFTSLIGQSNGANTQKVYEICSETYPSFRYGASGETLESLPVEILEVAGGCYTTPPVLTCPKYRIKVPFSVSNDPLNELYITYKLCGAMSPVTVAYSMMLQQVLFDEDATQVFICSEIQPYFSIGPYGYAQEIPGATITNEGVECDSGGGGTPPPNGCVNCYDEGKKCINNICETGIKIYTQSYNDMYSGLTICVYHYEWSDGSWSTEYTQYNPFNIHCVVGVLDPE